MAERGTGGKILSLATKRARRVQEKMLQKLGKSDQTKDDVFQDFVSNFHLQSMAATKLSKELMKFMSAIRTLSQCTNSLSATLLELYEPSWAGHNEYKNILETRTLLWDDQLVTLQSTVVDPMNNYMQKFPDVKNRIQKRERKVVDYDLRRRELETLRTKQKVTDQKLQQVEDTYSLAKQRFDEITDDLYEELPSFFDSRIQFYASVFQNLSSSDTHFHAEMSKVDQEFSVLMNELANEAVTSIHSTKKERTLDSIPKLLSRPGEDEDSDESESLTSAPELPVNHSSFHESPNFSPVRSSSPSHSETSSSKTSKHVVTPGDGNGSLRRQPPSKPTRSSSAMEQNAGEQVDPAVQKSKAILPSQGSDSVPLSPMPQSPQEQSINFTPSHTPQQDSRSPVQHDLSDADLAELEGLIDLTEGATPNSPPPSFSSKPEEVEPKPEIENPGPEVHNPEPEIQNTKPEILNPDPEEQNPESEAQTPEPDAQNPELEVLNPDHEVLNPEPEVQTPEPETPNPEPETPNPVPETLNPVPEVETPTPKEPENVLYKVVATHPYDGEDEDELSFLKGDIIAVIPYVDPDDEEDGWATGVILMTGVKGIFPENFTKKLE